MHQPDYRDPHSSVAAAPWVRLRATKDYLDMLVLATEHENVKVTFNLVPTLIEQFQFYQNGGSDHQLELNLLNPAETNQSQKHQILGNAFKCHPETMIKPHSRYYKIFLKWENSKKENSTANFTDDDIRDAQVWSNLTWVDPLFRRESPIKILFEKGENFSEQDKIELINWQKAHIAKIIPAYVEMLKQKRIDLSFSPYFHPILPLLCDSDSAKEALPDITLPSQRFKHPEDARRQIQMSMELYESLFNRRMTGMWPSEGSLSEETVQICAGCGINWVAGDEQVLFRSLQKSQMDITANHPCAVYRHSSGVKMFFRDHILSDKIGFVYSGWDPEKAVTDFISHIKNAGKRLSNNLDEVVVPVILDGENSWEFYQNDGLDFIRALYKNLSDYPEVETITMSEAAERLPERSLKTVFAGSWIDHNFRIWIGHEEDNAAWDYLETAREFLVNFEKLNSQFDKKLIESAWQEIYNAEGSDWFWWYGDEHRGPDNYIFDILFRNHLIRVYELLESEVPDKLRSPITTEKNKPLVLMPDALVTPSIDGKLSHFYEWFGAGRFECIASGTTMHRVFRLISTIYFGFDHDFFYLRLDFANLKNLTSIAKPFIAIRFNLPGKKAIMAPIKSINSNGVEDGKYQFAISEIFEIAIPRKFLWTEGFGKLPFTVEIMDGKQVIEKWPESGLIECELPEKHKELFWHQ